MSKTGITKMQAAVIAAILVIAAVIGVVGYYYLTSKPRARMKELPTEKKWRRLLDICMNYYCARVK